MQTWVVITAAGSSTRMGAMGNKLAVLSSGKPIIVITVEAFIQAGFDNIVVVIPSNCHAYYNALLASHPVVFAEGGTTRQESVYRGLKVLPAGCEYVLIHDGARPFVSSTLIHRVLSSAKQCGACIPVVSLSDTIYETRHGELSAILDRDKLGAVQTPQGFELELVLRAHENARALGLSATDDAALVKALGSKVLVVEGERSNIKITRPEDIIAVKPMSQVRTGLGIDVHRLVEGRPLILAGVHIPSVLGLLGHSDADVIIHATMDALLGAIGLGDIGQHFPDTDEKYLGANSMDLLSKVLALLKASQAEVLNVDLTLLLERPKIAPYKEQMQQNIAAALGINVNRVNVKATTNEGLGYIGAGEGAACYAVATVSVPG
ncbi:MAG: 2-C-methyl-D-erythritol 4-phosphate cytidylyltransferase [Bacillota bacterium]|nr:2-C-methyl-D-erythritol 4-phosphate cytidylyltransferase [Bacillota bacterium]